MQQLCLTSEYYRDDRHLLTVTFGTQFGVLMSYLLSPDAQPSDPGEGCSSASRDFGRPHSGAKGLSKLDLQRGDCFPNIFLFESLAEFRQGATLNDLYIANGLTKDRRRFTQAKLFYKPQNDHMSLICSQFMLHGIDDLLEENSVFPGLGLKVPDGRVPVQGFEPDP